MESLADELAAVAVHLAQHTGRFLELLAELDRGGIWARHGARTMADWLAFRVQMSVIPSSRRDGREPFCSRAAHTGMTVEKAIRVLAGTFVLASLVLAQLASPWWLLLTAFVGVNLFQSAFTGFCPAELLLRRLGVGQRART